MNYEIIPGNCLTTLPTLPAKSVQCCVTSPPYFGLRNYNGGDAEIGLEASPALYVARLVAVFREVWKVLADDGVLWLNLGDSYATQGGNHAGRQDQQGVGGKCVVESGNGDKGNRKPPSGLKPKDLIGIPWRVAFALQDDGWYLRSDIIWSKPNAMPESVTDRCTRAHEYVFMLTKNGRYYYDADAIKEKSAYPDDDRKARSRPDNKEFQDAKHARMNPHPDKQRGHSRRHDGFNDRWDTMTKAEQQAGMRNKRDVWTIAPATYDGAHFATMPPALAAPCILAGSRPGDTVLDPFCGSGTTGAVALKYGRKFVGCELNPDYIELAHQHIGEYANQPLLMEV